MKKEILIDFQSLKNLNCGLGQFSLNLAKSIQKNNKKFNLTYLLPKDKSKYFHGVEYEYTTRWKKYPFHTISRHLTYKKRYDIWHTCEQISKFFPTKTTIPNILTIHDLNFIRENSKNMATEYKKLQKKVNRATIITTISNFVAKDIKEHLDIGNKEIKVIYNGLNKNLYLAKRPNLRQIEKPFLFTIGEVLPKKNFHVLIDFIKKTDYNLIVSGRSNTQYANRIKEMIKKFNLEKRVSISGIINQGEKKWLYQNCSAFVFPSLTEGFGLPVIEAMEYGKPIFVSNNTSLPEIAQNFAFYWHDFNANYMNKVFQEGMSYYMQNPDLKDKIIEHAKSFSWDRASKEYLKLYENVLKSKDR